MNQELIDKYRDINVDYDDWYDYIYDDFVEHCKERGVEIDMRQAGRRNDGSLNMRLDITWSGFWSQRDGAAFAGYVVDLGKFLGKSYDDYPILQKYVEELGGYYNIKWETGNNNNVSGACLEVEQIGLYLDDDHPFVEVWSDALDAELEGLEEDIDSEVEDLCSHLYRMLEKEYEQLTSDEAVWEAIVANELNEEEDDE